ncbi:hypothetical protein E3N88_09677 [Mikania micrantha]|uniref:Retroviral polymerase SH3-like domain-containing protein n=1 Tax=Mikania micrantha TaxID=192012 RepID=A0A5N6PLQ6_9ASTR|nr:hypothetical protein E3N88_09677 [Mikania micrantha]
MMVPMEKWSVETTDYEHLRVFGSLVYSHVSQDKLNPRAQKCIMIGYPEGVKGYRLLRLGTGGPKVIVSRNVVFKEDIMYKDLQVKSTDKIYVKGNEVEIEVESTPEKEVGEIRLCCLLITKVEIVVLVSLEVNLFVSLNVIK